jgi:hypothetical protein
MGCSTQRDFESWGGSDILIFSSSSLERVFYMKILIAVLAVLSATSAFAHHSFEAEFDKNKTVVLTGTVTKVDWMNPHIYIHLDAKDETGKSASWACEGGNPGSLMRNGWKRNSLKPGDQIVIDGYRAKDGTNTCNGRSVKLADGTKLFAGSSAGNQE